MSTMHVCKCYKKLCYVDFIIDKFSCIFEMGSCGL